MKKTILLIILACFVSLSFGQYGKGSPETIESWKDKTLVVIEYPTSPTYNNSVKTVVNERWYNDKIEYIKFKNRKGLKKREDIVILSVKLDVVGSPLICLDPKMIKKDDYFFSYDKNGSVAIPVQPLYWKNSSDTSWKDENAIKFDTKLMMEYKKNMYNSNIISALYVLNQSSSERIKLMIDIIFNTSDQFKTGEYVFTNPRKHRLTYNKKVDIDLLKGKTLLIEEKCIPTESSSPENNKELLDSDYLKSLYKGNIKVVSEEELMIAIKKQNENEIYLILNFSGTFNLFSIIDLKDRKIIYCGMEKAKPGDTNKMQPFKRMLPNIYNHRY